MVFLISKHQAPSLASWRPALWIPGIRDFHRAQVQWRLGCDHQTLMEVIPAVLRAGGFIVYSQDSGKITAGHLSNELQFLHHVTIRIARQQPSSVVLEVTCGSAAVCPAWVPLVLLFSIPLCWIPFPDCGENERLLEKIKARGSTACKEVSAAMPATMVFFIVFIMGPALLVLTFLNFSGITRVAYHGQT